MERLEPNQKDFLTWEFGVFFHFGIRSFYPGHRDWDNREMPPEGFFPDAYDPEQWVRPPLTGRRQRPGRPPMRSTRAIRGHLCRSSTA